MASLSPEIVIPFSGFPITNTILATILIDILLIVFIFYGASHIKKIPGKFQNAVESLFLYFHDMAVSMAGVKRAAAIFPWVMTFFIVIVATNFLGLMPGIGSFGIREEVIHSEEKSTTKIQETNEKAHTTDETEKNVDEKLGESKPHLITLIRPATSDFNATLALATISLIATHALGIKYTGLTSYLKRFFSLNPILLFVGLLELVSEFIKIFSLSFRLFGNIYAGEVVLSTISGLFAFLAPLPFLLLESIVAIVQALVFAMLTLVFMTMLTEKHGEEH